MSRPPADGVEAAAARPAPAAGTAGVTVEKGDQRVSGTQTAAAVATVSDLIAGYLVAAGAKYIFGLPGGQNIEFMEAARRRGMEFVLARREGTAALMASAAGELTGVPGVCMSTLGPGSTNLVNGVAHAFLDRAPLIAISGQLSSRLAPTFTHQNVDHRRLFAPVTKWATDVVPQAAGAIMRRALRLAVAERPGPVHLTLNADYARADAAETEIQLPPLKPSGTFTAEFAADGVSDVLDLIRKARRPVVVAGIAATRAGAGPALRRLAETAGAPVVVAPKAKGIFPEDHPLFACTLDMACNKLVWEFLAGADLVLAAGFDAVELIKDWRVPAPTVHIDAIPNVDQVYQAQVELVGDIAAILDALADAWPQASAWEEREVQAHRERVARQYYKGRVAGRLNPTDVVDLVQAGARRDTLVTADVGSHKLLVGQGWKAYEPRSVWMSNGLSTMGSALPAAIAAKLVLPERPVVCFTGDGGFAMVYGELEVAASLGLNMLVVVFCDQSLNRIEIKQQQKGYPSWGTRLPQSDLVKLAEGLGCYGARATTPEEFAAAIDGWMGLDRPLVVEAQIDPAQYNEQF
ncbi:MAG TPA: thiamine pyrophosphate-binding protein [Limnochordales bacterium]